MANKTTTSSTGLDLQSILDEKDKQLQQVGTLGQRILAQQMELEERIWQLRELEDGIDKDGNGEELMRIRQEELVATLAAWKAENAELLHPFVDSNDTSDKYKDENGRLGVTLEQLRARLSDSNATIQSLEGEKKRLNNLIFLFTSSRPSVKMYKDESERFLGIVDNLKAMHDRAEVLLTHEHRKAQERLSNEIKSLQENLSEAGRNSADLKETIQNLRMEHLAKTEEWEATRDLIGRLGAIFDDVSLYKKLLACREADAQKLLDTFQVLLDTPSLIPRFKRNLLVATQRLSHSAGMYPKCYDLNNIDMIDDNPVAAGGFADIYKGRYSGQVVCLKVIRIYQTSHVQSFLKRFSAEAILWGQLSHPNLLPTYGLYRLNGRLCLVAPWMDNGDLPRYLKENPEVVRKLLVLDVASGLGHLHDQGIVHGDLKGANILIDTCGRARIADFGLSSVTDSEILHWTGYSSARSRGGSIRWQAPELFDFQNDDLINNTKSSDVYAFACVAYEIFINRLPFFEAPRDAAVMAKVQAGERPSRPEPSSQAWTKRELSEDAWSLLQSCWSRDPSHRPNISEVVQFFHSTIAVDGRPHDTVDSVISSPKFRESVGGKPDLPSVLDLEAMIRGGGSSSQDEEALPLLATSPEPAGPSARRPIDAPRAPSPATNSPWKSWFGRR